MKLHEHYVKDYKKNLTDLIYFNEKGEIIAWMLHSDVLGEWFSVSLDLIKREKPATFAKFKKRLKEEIIPSGDFDTVDVDFQIDQAKDDAHGESA